MSQKPIYGEQGGCLACGILCLAKYYWTEWVGALSQ
jgi:hypothetical protein